MPSGFSRSDRVAEQIRRELAELIRLELKDPRVRLVTITGVEVTSDYAHARVYYTSLLSPDQRQALDRGLKRSAGFLRREIGRRVKIHHNPELHFVFDESVERGSHLSQLIDQAVASDVSGNESSEAA